jgi:sarcosine oxidase subunit beta
MKGRGKIIVCRCEDVTQDDLARAVATGFTDVEEVKRYTGFGTGPCQGKECLRNAVVLIAALAGRDEADQTAFTTRPPLAPTELRFFAGARPGRDPERS